MDNIKITDNTSKDYLNEIINILMQIRKFQSRPRAKLLPIYQFSRIMIIIGTPFLILFLTLGIKDRSTIFMMLSTLLAVCLLIMGIVLNSLGKLRKNIICDSGESALTIDSDGVEFRSLNRQTVRLDRSQIAYVRVFKHSVCFVPRNLTGFLINTDKSYADEIIQAVKAETPDIEIIR